MEKVLDNGSGSMVGEAGADGCEWLRGGAELWRGEVGKQVVVYLDAGSLVGAGGNSTSSFLLHLQYS